MWHGRIVDRIVQASGLLALLGLTHYEVADIDDVAQLADFARCFRLLEKLLGLLIENVEAVPCTVKTEVGTIPTYVPII